MTLLFYKDSFAYDFTTGKIAFRQSTGKPIRIQAIEPTKYWIANALNKFNYVTSSASNCPVIKAEWKENRLEWSFVDGQKEKAGNGIQQLLQLLK